jgi:hypothetical protein
MIWKIDRNARVSGVTSENIQAIGNELRRIAEKNGVIDPSEVVKEAEAITSPLHPVFEWDDDKAASAHRIWQARNLIKSVRVVTGKGEESLEQRVYVNVVTGTARGYMHVPAVMSDDVLRYQVLAKAKADLAAWRERYKELHELSLVFTVVDEVLLPQLTPALRGGRPVEEINARP